jgi:hypothetical protein
VHDYEIGQIRGRYRDGVLVDRGRVVKVSKSMSNGFRYAQTIWECGGQSCDEERILHVTTGTITYQDLERAGISSEEFRRGRNGRLTDYAWSIAENHRRLLRNWLEPQGFDVGKDIAARELPSGDQISLTQEFPVS